MTDETPFNLAVRHDVTKMKRPPLPTRPNPAIDVLAAPLNKIDIEAASRAERARIREWAEGELKERIREGSQWHLRDEDKQSHRGRIRQLNDLLNFLKVLECCQLGGCQFPMPHRHERGRIIQEIL